MGSTRIDVSRNRQRIMDDMSQSASVSTCRCTFETTWTKRLPRNTNRSDDATKSRTIRSPVSVRVQLYAFSESYVKICRVEILRNNNYVCIRRAIPAAALR